MHSIRHKPTLSTRPIRTILSMILDDAVDERLIPADPVRRRRRCGRRRDHTPSPRERVWAMPDQVLRIAEQATRLGGPSAGLLVITTAWTGCRTTKDTSVSPHHHTPTISMNESGHARGPNDRAPSPCLLTKGSLHLSRVGLPESCSALPCCRKHR